MNLDDAETIAKLISPFAELVMLYFTGEPLLHPDFFGFLRVMRSQVQGRLVVSTNATLLGSANRRALLDSGADVIICSVDGATKETYERIRKGASFEVVVSNVQALLAERGGTPCPEIVVKCIDFQVPPMERATFVRHWRSLGASSHISWLNNWGGTYNFGSKASATQFPYQSRLRVPCAELWFKMVVNWRGEVVMCCIDWRSDVVLGDLTGVTHVGEIWHNDMIRQLRRAHVKRQTDDLAVCSSCSQWSTIDELRHYQGASGYEVVF
jgi:MoaA/NifB/PqqE/SkfB family radical SAM enzyme